MYVMIIIMHQTGVAETIFNSNFILFGFDVMIVQCTYVLYLGKKVQSFFLLPFIDVICFAICLIVSAIKYKQKLI